MTSTETKLTRLHLLLHCEHALHGAPLALQPRTGRIHWTVQQVDAVSDTSTYAVRRTQIVEVAPGHLHLPYTQGTEACGWTATDQCIPCGSGAGKVTPAASPRLYMHTSHKSNTQASWCNIKSSAPWTYQSAVTPKTPSTQPCMQP